MAASFRIEGLRELEEALKELPKATAKNTVRRALLKAGQPIASAAAADAPRLKGKLQMSIGTGTKLSRRQKRLNKPASEVEIYVGAGALVQAITQEFGTANHPAKPFMRPAWDGGKLRALGSIRNDLAEEIEKARARLARKAARIAAQIKA